MTAFSIVATHWDTDHINGLNDIYQEAKDAYFVFSQALKEEDFLKLIFGASYTQGTIKSSTSEIKAIIEIFKDRTQSQNYREIIFANENKNIHKDEVIIDKGKIERSIISLSPSNAACLKSLYEISKLLPVELEPLRNFRQLRPNHTSIVLLIEIGGICLLLGSDLEELGDQQDGWSAIVNNRIQPNSKAETFKIPHHGSSNGHNHDVWKNFVHSHNFSLLTPFHHGKTQIPTIDDLKRINSYSENAYIAGASSQTSFKTDRETKNMLRKVNKNLYRVERKLGQVTLRKNIFSNDDWSIKLEGEACNINDLIN